MTTITDHITQIDISKEQDSSRNSISITKRKVTKMKTDVRQYYDRNGYLSWSQRKRKYVILGTNSPGNGLVDCPQCHIGKLFVVRSRQTGKRFIGCSNYYNGCKASSPLIQRGMIYATKIPCKGCCRPVIFFMYSIKKNWSTQCSHINV